MPHNIATPLTLRISALREIQIVQYRVHLAQVFLGRLLDERTVHLLGFLAFEEITVLEIWRLVHADGLDGDGILRRQIRCGDCLGTVTAAAHARRIDFRRLQFDQGIQCA